MSDGPVFTPGPLPGQPGFVAPVYPSCKANTAAAGCSTVQQGNIVHQVDYIAGQNIGVNQSTLYTQDRRSKVYDPGSRTWYDPGLAYNAAETVIVSGRAVPRAIAEAAGNPASPYFQAADLAMRTITGFFRSAPRTDGEVVADPMARFASPSDSKPESSGTPWAAWIQSPFTPKAGTNEAPVTTRSAVAEYNPIDAATGVIKNFYVPEGNYMQQQLTNVKVGKSESGEVSWYEQLGRNEAGQQRMTVNPETGKLESFMLIGGGGRAAAQSGTIGFAAATPAVFGRGEVQRGAYGLVTPNVMAPGVESSGLTGVDIFHIVELGNMGRYDIRDVLSRLGAEAYGGTVQKIDNRTLGSITYEDVSSRAPWNLARYADPLAVNKGKAELPGANIPWSVGKDAPAMFFMDQYTNRREIRPVETGIFASLGLNEYGGNRPNIQIGGSSELNNQYEYYGEPNTTLKATSVPAFGAYFPQYGSAYEGGDVTGMGARQVEAPLVITSAMGMRESGVSNAGRLVGGKTVASVASTGPAQELPSFQDYYSGQQTEYKNLMAAYEAGGATDEGMYNDLLARRKRLIALGTGQQGLDIVRSAIPETVVETKPQSGALPFFGVVPGISSLIQPFQPVEITKTTKIAGISFTETGYGPTPFTMAVQKVTPEMDQAAASFKAADIANPFTSPIALSSVISEYGTERFNPSDLTATRERNAMVGSLVGLGGKYEGFREDPSMAVFSYALGFGFGGAGGVLRSGGIGTKFLAPASKSGELYQSASKVASGTLAGMYGSDVVERVTGSPIGAYQRAALPAFYGEGEAQNIADNWQGIGQATKAANKIATTEMIPFVFGVGHGAYVGDRLAQRIQTRGLTEIKNPEEFTYFTEEGFPTNPKITTDDLVESFNAGTMRLKGGNKALQQTIMSPTGKPLDRIPSNPQRDTAIFGETHIYSGSETPHLDTGIVGAGHSEIPGMYNAPTGQAYFTKAGMNQGGGGIGMTSDLLGIYRNPTMYRTTVKTGDYVRIPEKILNTPTQGMSINDPTNPRNVAITNWIEGNAPFGKPIIGQYGKSEWQTIIREGSQLTSKKVGYFVDQPTGNRIMLYDVSFTGKGVAPVKQINKATGKPYGRQVGKVYTSFGGVSSESGISKTIPPITSMMFGKPTGSVSTSRKSASSMSPSVSYPAPSISPSARSGSERPSISRAPSRSVSGRSVSSLAASSFMSDLFSPSRTTPRSVSRSSGITEPFATSRPPSISPSPTITTPPPYSKVPSPTTPSPPTYPKITPGWFDGGGYPTGFTRTRRAAFAETFNMGLDLSIAGRRTGRAKSFATPKSKRRAAPVKAKRGKKK